MIVGDIFEIEHSYVCLCASAHFEIRGFEAGIFYAIADEGEIHVHILGEAIFRATQSIADLWAFDAAGLHLLGVDGHIFGGAGQYNHGIAIKHIGFDLGDIGFHFHIVGLQDFGGERFRRDGGDCAFDMVHERADDEIGEERAIGELRHEKHGDIARAGGDFTGFDGGVSIQDFS